VLAGPWVKNELWRRARAVPSLDLRFAENKSLVDATTGAQLVTFTRASSGTFVGSDGVLQTAVTNLLLRSEEFDNASWTKTRTSVTANAIAAPNGTLTADKIVEDNSSSTHLVLQGSPIAGLAYVYSVYAKAAERSRLTFAGGGFGAQGFAATFDLSSGTIPVNTGNKATIVSVGDGWYRCIVAFTPSNTVAFELYLDNGSTNNYTGDNTSGLYLWGAQLEQSSTVGEYIPTTSTINSAPRFDHNPTTGESLGLLVEEQRTNLLLNSATLSTQSVTVAAAANTLSFYGTGTVTLTGVSTAGPLVGTGANDRVSLTFTPTVGVLILTVSGSVTNAQLEAGAFPTSYIPTTAATVTRSADVASISGSNFSSWYRQDEGTVFAEFLPRANATAGVAYLNAGNVNEATRIFYNAAVSNYTLSVRAASVEQSSINNLGAYVLQSERISATYKVNDLAASRNGGTSISDTSATLPTGIDRLELGTTQSANYLNGTIRRLTYWPQRLPDSTLQAVTQ
jgi:hypothetical protein